jgi:hypothetical protein
MGPAPDNTHGFFAGSTIEALNEPISDRKTRNNNPNFPKYYCDLIPKNRK